MTTVEWDPFRNIGALQDRINRLFDDSFPGVAKKLDNAGSKGAFKPVTDIYETEDKIILKAELPGVDREKVSIEVKGASLTISGERQDDKTASGKNYYQKERRFGAFLRMFSLKDPPNPEKIKAAFKDGVLTITIPKPAAEKPKRIVVEVS
ncbi:Hsp20/alpha crystallin family protein [Thermodesulfobacteriota bacterium]